MAQRKRRAKKRGKVTIKVQVPNLTVEDALALDLPNKVKSTVLHSVIGSAIKYQDPGWGETCDVRWGENGE
jgi:hypothetical protein